ncbi:hypothetical protein JJB09_13805 [Rhizobium sp. KVB221]|uniref:Polysaccharide pyruvyl transferase domain-containing protein n=1 Tax=Rhizobium setariae TaxID=2801340 RepID=A0A936YME0_9HYPH|nr:polysaccharide pyruvyl transferase family protein [Rhizobium setariae]MBL0373105.1 hypothetical protein [Rhizobium setariae]
MEHIFRTIRSLEWNVLASFFGNTFMFEKSAPELDENILRQADVIVINGEGTIHHDSPMAVFLLDTIERFKDKKICLVNTVWQDISPAYAEKLKHIDLVVARDHRSYRSIASIYSGRLHIVPDFSYLNVPFHAPMADQGVLFGGFYWGQHASSSGLQPAQLALKQMDRTNNIDITKENWHVAVNRLRSARLLVTGKHHDVMAACVARCPFLFCPIPTHKISALGEFAGVELAPIDMSLSEQQYLEMFEETARNRDQFDALFDGMSSAARQFSLEKALLSVLD